MLDKNGFDLWAKEYDNTVNSCYISKQYPFDGYYDVLNCILNMVEPNSTVLDVGFGTGILTKKIYDLNCNVYGIDFSSEMVSISKAKMPNGKFYECDFNNDLPNDILNQKFDYIISTYAIHHLTDDKKVDFIMLLKTLLNKNGKIIIGDVAFETNQELVQCESDNISFDKEEIYIVADSFIESLKQVNIKAEYKKMSHCAGILTIEEI